MEGGGGDGGRMCIPDREIVGTRCHNIAVKRVAFYSPHRLRVARQ